MYEYAARITRVVDGDTVDAEVDLGFSIKFKERFRLAGINAPETRTRNKKEKKAGLRSKEFLVQALGHMRVYQSDAAAIKIVTAKDAKGKYGRYIGSLVLAESFEFEFEGKSIKLAKGTNLNKELVRRKLAKFVKY